MSGNEDAPEGEHSGEQTDQGGTGGQSGESEGEGQSQGEQSPNQGQSQSPQGGQPQGGGQQPQGGQPQGGGQQPQGSYEQSRARGQQTGPSVGDIFSRPDTKGEIVSGTVIFGMVGVGLLLAAFLVPLGGSFSTMVSMLGGGLALLPVLAVLLAREHHDTLSEVPDTLVYATSGVTALAGSVVLGVLGGVGGSLGASVGGPPSVQVGGRTVQAPSVSFPIGDYVVAAVLVGIAAAIVAAATVAVQRRVLDSGQVRQSQQVQQTQQAQQAQQARQSRQGRGGQQGP